ncbi:MAG: YegS/Rv2252/BmrU family lipid kinase [Bacteroidales bacterium]|jgi:YegS/Rv2252/BmrU family lipid kinase|nr:YegS/Rv2252/BmrU family lipid kinase [Bacteroidales bacterium]
MKYLDPLYDSTTSLNVHDFCWQIIVNPNAMSGKGKQICEKIFTLLAENQISFEKHIADGSGIGEKTVLNLCKSNKYHFIVFGGDGTLNEVINGILKSGVQTDKVFVVPFPIGTGNDWSRTHAYPKNAVSVMDAFLNGYFAAHDVGCVKLIENETITGIRYFINIAGFGFDAAVIEQTANGKSSFFSAATYIVSLLKVLFKYHSTNVLLQFPNQKVEAELFSLAVGICRYNGNGMKQVPMANPYDGFLDVVLIRKISVAKAMANVVRLFRGKHLKIKEVSVYQTQSLILNAEPAIGCETEGEMLPKANIYDIKILAKSVQLLVI